MFDTNIFNSILDGKASLGTIKDGHTYFVTHIQRDELQATSGTERRKELLKTFEVINQMLIPTESAVWDVSRWGLAKWSEEDGMYEKILEQLEKEKPHDRGNIKDALVGETAIRNCITLVTNDKSLRDAVEKLGGVAICLSDFLKETRGKY
jgi:predicted nucleic acid-binding protein